MKKTTRAKQMYDRLNQLDPPGTPAAVLIREARVLERLQGKRRRTLKVLKELDRQIRLTKKSLRAVAQQVTLDQTPPLKVFGER